MKGTQNVGREPQLRHAGTDEKVLKGFYLVLCCKEVNRTNSRHDPVSGLSGDCLLNFNSREFPGLLHNHNLATEDVYHAAGSAGTQDLFKTTFV
jgi:hypothetical protein